MTLAALSNITPGAPSDIRRAVEYCMKPTKGSHQTEMPVVIVGSGRIGRALLHMSKGRARILRRGQHLEDIVVDKDCRTFDGPILVATHNSDLESVLSQIPESHWKDLVWLQGGMILPWLTARGLWDTTQALLYMAALLKDPADPASDIVVTDGGGRSVVCGRWAHGFADLLQSGGVRCREVDRTVFLQRMIEKLLWASIFWLLCEAYGGITCGQVANQHREAVADLTAELLPLGTRYLQSRSSESDSEDMAKIFEVGSQTESGKHTNRPSGASRTFQTLQESSQTSRSVEDPSTETFVASVETSIVEEGAFHSASFETSTTLLEVDVVVENLCQYSLSIKHAVPSVSMAVKEFEWRNGWFLRQAQTPLHVKWIERVGLAHLIQP